MCSICKLVGKLVLGSLIGLMLFSHVIHARQVRSVTVLYTISNKDDSFFTKYLYKGQILENQYLQVRNGRQSLEIVAIEKSDDANVEDKSSDSKVEIEEVTNPASEVIGWKITIPPHKTAHIPIIAKCAMRGYPPPEKGDEYLETPLVNQFKPGIIIYPIEPENWQIPDGSLFSKLRQGVIDSNRFVTFDRQHENKILELWRQETDSQTFEAAMGDLWPLKGPKLVLFTKVIKREEDRWIVEFVIKRKYERDNINSQSIDHNGSYDQLLLKIREVAQSFCLNFKP